METTFRINTDLLNIDLVENIKRMFPHKEVEITVNASDATEYIKSNPDYEKELMERINDYNLRKDGIIMKENDLL